MPQSFLSEADGRVPRARRAIRKLVALGFGSADVGELMRLEKGRVPPKRVRRKRAHDNADREARLLRAQWAIRTMLALGFTECEIGELAEVGRTTIVRALGVLQSVGHGTLDRLMKAVQSAGAERLKVLLPRVAITVLDTCCDKGRLVDDAVRAEIAEGIRADLLNALVFGSSPAPIMPGILSFLAQLGDPLHGLYVFKAPFEKADTPEERIIRLLLSEHELEHLLQRFRAERWQLESAQSRESHLPKEGRIA